jgi:hypothetical protein
MKPTLHLNFVSDGPGPKRFVAKVTHDTFNAWDREADEQARFTLPAAFLKEKF